LLSWAKWRILLLNNILNQKYGLFFHSKNEFIESNSDSNEFKKKKSNSNVNKSEEIKFNFNNIDYLIFKKTPNNNKIEYEEFKYFSSYESIMNTQSFNILLKGIYFDDGDENSLATEDDPLLKFGVKFKKDIIKDKIQTQNENKISTIYDTFIRLNNFSKIDTKNNDIIKNILKNSEFNIILKLSRIYHFIRIPLYFNKINLLYFQNSNNMLINLKNDNNKKISLKIDYLLSDIREKNIKIDIGEDRSFMEEVELNRRLINSFLEEYISYLETMDFKILTISNENESVNEKIIKRPVIKIAKYSIGLNPIKIYLQKVYSNGVLIIELGK
jgi:hypothetical protein